MSGFKPISVRTENRKYVFEFKDSEKKAELTALNFLGSECAAYDSCMRTLRSMLNNKKISK